MGTAAGSSEPYLAERRERAGARPPPPRRCRVLRPDVLVQGVGAQCRRRIAAARLIEDVAERDVPAIGDAVVDLELELERLGRIVVERGLRVGRVEDDLGLAARDTERPGRDHRRVPHAGDGARRVSSRRASRERPLESESEEADAGEFEALFDARGHWQEAPPAWDDPDGALHQRQFLAALEKCLEALPAKTARCFLMREHMGLETEEICKELAVTPTHCWVLLYRARMALRQCLETGWFAK